jgi:hypothetical protein
MSRDTFSKVLCILLLMWRCILLLTQVSGEEDVKIRWALVGGNDKYMEHGLEEVTKEGRPELPPKIKHKKTK